MIWFKRISLSLGLPLFPQHPLLTEISPAVFHPDLIFLIYKSNLYSLFIFHCAPSLGANLPLPSEIFSRKPFSIISSFLTGVISPDIWIFFFSLNYWFCEFFSDRLPFFPSNRCRVRSYRSQSGGPPPPLFCAAPFSFIYKPGFSLPLARMDPASGSWVPPPYHPSPSLRHPLFPVVIVCFLML